MTSTEGRGGGRISDSGFGSDYARDDTTVSLLQSYPRVQPLQTQRAASDSTLDRASGGTV